MNNKKTIRIEIMDKCSTCEQKNKQKNTILICNDCEYIKRLLKK